MALSRRGAFLRQARSDFAVFDYLLRQGEREIPDCHPLHYLQMSAEKLAKAILDALNESVTPFSHVAFSQLPYRLARADVARAMGFRDFRAYREFLRRAAPVFRAIDELSPAVGASQVGGGSKEGPNVEYPWPARDEHGHETWITPADHHFGLLSQIRRSGDAAQVMWLIRTLLDRFDEIFA